MKHTSQHVSGQSPSPRHIAWRPVVISAAPAPLHHGWGGGVWGEGRLRQLHSLDSVSGT